MRTSLAVLTIVLATACGDSEEGSADADSGMAHSSGELEPTCDERDQGEGSSPFDLESDIACGLETFEADCAVCHGASGEGTDAGPELSEHVVNHTDEQLVFLILAGTDDMPAQDLTPQQSADVLAWLRDAFGPYNGEGH